MTIKKVDEGDTLKAAVGDEAIAAATAAALGDTSADNGVVITAHTTTGPNPDPLKPQSVPPGAIQLNGQWVVPTGSVERDEKGDVVRRAPFVFRDGVLMAREDADRLFAEQARGTGE